MLESVIEIHKNEFPVDYEQLSNNPSFSFFISPKYILLLKEFLKDDFYIIVCREGGAHISGVIPFFLKIAATGKVLNSLPFYGSNGGVIAKDEVTAKLLFDSIYDFAIKNQVSAYTIISHPLDSNVIWFDKHISHDFKDSRIGQLTPIGLAKNEEQLIELFHFKTRNMVRKGAKAAFEIDYVCGEKYLEFLINTHKENIESIGGLAKPRLFFENLQKFFIYEKDYRIYYALYGGQPVAALLTFYYNGIVEYFTPVILSQYRNMQPMSAIIFQVMKDSLKDNFMWNWGGTWLSQGGVYQFKSRWGTKDFPYYYYVKIFDKEILNRKSSYLLSEFPYYYVAPFNALNNGE